MTTLPACIKARRVGHHSMGSENEYDATGEQAPITWTCNCGSWLVLDYYVQTSEGIKAEFLAAHTACTAKCFKCGVVDVERQGYWCDQCSDAE